jgi:hypothetical protein
MSNMLPCEEHITVGDVRRDWDLVLPGLMVIHDTMKPAWRPEDMYALCRNGEAYLYLYDEGFAIVGRVCNTFSLEIELHVYAMYSEGRESCLKYLPFFQGLAKEVGATKITMETSHKQEAMERYGWEIEYSRYKRSVS